MGWLWPWCGICASTGRRRGEEELAEFETDVLAGFVLARASAGLVDSTIREYQPPGADPGLVRPAAVGDAAGGRGRSLAGQLLLMESGP